jgi:hypothetical protein
MVLFGMVAAWVSMGNNANIGSSSSNSSSSLIKSFNNIEDSLSIIPTGATYVRYSNLEADPLIGNFLNSYYWNTLPSYQIFDANASIDTLAIYPAEYFGDLQSTSAGSVISLTDFDNATLNQSYSQINLNMNGNIIPMSKVYSNYYFTPKTSPVVSGTQNAVNYTLGAMAGYVNTAMADYSGLFNELSLKQIPINNMTLETVGNNATFPISSINLSINQFYAGMGPTNQTMVVNNTTYTKYSYTVILSVNQTPSNSDAQYLYLLSSSNEKMGFEDYNVQLYDKYIVIQAHAPMVVCMNDMMTWGFMKYEAGASQ